MSQITPDQVGPPSRIEGNLPTLMVVASIILLLISLASFTHTPVNSRDNNFFTSSGLSNAKNKTSNSKSACLIQCVYGTLHINFPHSSSGNQSSHVLIVVVLSCGFVFLMIAQRERLIPFSLGFCCKALRKTSTQQATDLPDPTGPRIPRKKESSFIKDLTTSPSGLYLKSVNPIILSYFN